MEIAPADSADVVNRPAAPFPLDVWQVRDAIVVVVLAMPDRLVDCDDPRTQAVLAPVRGLRITLDTTYSPTRDLTQVIVRRGDRVLRPLVVERHTVRRLGAGGFRVPREAWMRLVFDRAELAPGPTGRVDDLTVEVVDATGGSQSRIALPWIAVRIAWESALAARPVFGAVAVPYRVARRAAAGARAPGRGHSAGPAIAGVARERRCERGRGGVAHRGVGPLRHLSRVSDAIDRAQRAPERDSALVPIGRAHATDVDQRGRHRRARLGRPGSARAARGSRCS